MPDVRALSIVSICAAIMLPHDGLGSGMRQAEDRQSTFEHDDDRDAEQRDREHRRQDVRQHLAEHHAPALRALGARRHHELALRPRERVRAGDSGEDRDRNDPDRDDDHDECGWRTWRRFLSVFGESTDTSVSASTSCGNASRMLNHGRERRVGAAAGWYPAMQAEETRR